MSGAYDAPCSDPACEACDPEPAGPSAEALATIPAENERRARLYDALWDVAYHRGGAALWTSGTDGTEFNISVEHGSLRFVGPLEEVERELTEYAKGLRR